MPPLSRPRRRRLMLLNESPNGNTVVESSSAETPAVSSHSAGTMQHQFLEDCGVPEGFEVQVTVHGRPEVHTVHLDEAFAFIGRDEECGVRLTGPEIGRHHAYLQAVAGQFIVVDLGSRTGIRQNGRAVRTALVSVGTSIEIGPYTLRITCEAGADFHEPPTEAQIQQSNPAIALAFVNQSKPIDPWTIDTPITLIGSAKPSRIRLEHATVTPQHCAIIRGFTRWWIVDLNSQSGTLVDSAPVSYTPLTVGTSLQIGRYRISIRKPRAAEPVIQPPVFDEGAILTPQSPHRKVPQEPSIVSFSPTSSVPAEPQAVAGQVVNEHLVVELFKEFAALHERTVSQLQQSFREMLEVATSNRPVLAAPVPGEPAPQLEAAVAEPVPQFELDDEPEQEPRIADLMHSDDAEERAAAQELLAAQMRSLEARLHSERDGFARRLLRSLSLTK